MKIKKLLIFTIIVLLFSTGLFSQNQLNRFELILQPFSKTRIYDGSKEIRYKIVKRDNTLAEIVFFNKNSNLKLRVLNINFREAVIDISAKNKKVVILDKLYSDYKFIKYFKTGIQPKSVTFLSENYVCLPLLADKSIDILDIRTGEIRKVAPPEEYARKKGFVETLVLDHRNEFWVSQMTTGLVHIFNLKTLEYMKSIKTSGKWCKVLSYNPDLDKVYLTNWITCDISVINPNNYTEEYKINTFGVPRGIIFSNDNKYAYVCQYYGGKEGSHAKGYVLKINLKTKKVVKRLGVAGYKRHMVKDEKNQKLYVSDMGLKMVSVFDMKTDKLLKQIKVFSHPNTIQLSPDSKFLYVSCRGPNNPKSYLIKGFYMGRIYVIDTESLKVKEFWEGGNQCTGLDVSKDGKKIIFSDFLDDAVRVYQKL